MTGIHTNVQSKLQKIVTLNKIQIQTKENLKLIDVLRRQQTFSIRNGVVRKNCSSFPLSAENIQKFLRKNF